MSVPREKKRVLFICTHNAARSQMAEGLLRALYGNRYDVFSAGTEPGMVSPYAIKVMADIGIDISAHRSKSLQEFLDQKFDYVITVCDHAKESCPYFPGGKKILHKSFEDPSALTGTEEEIMAGYRQVRDEIKSWIENEFPNG
jgi:arsenate reductase